MANLFSINNGKVTYNKVNINDIQTTVNSKNKIKQKKKAYKEELKVQNKLQNNINEYFGKQGVVVNTDNFGNTIRTPLTTQQHSNYVKNGFSVNRDPLMQNVKTEQQYQKLLKSDDYQQKKQDLINQSNVVGYSKYDYDRAVVENDKIGWYDKSAGRLIEGAKSIFDISGGMIKNKNGDYVYLPNKTELKSQKVNDSYETGVGKFLGNAAYEIGKIGGTTLINSVVPYAGSTAYFGRMFMDSTNNAIREGYAQDKAINYALASTTFEFVTGKLLGSATKGLTGGTNSQLSNAISNGITRLISNPRIASFIGNAGSEAVEEFIQEYLDNINRLVTLEGSTNAQDYIDVLFDKDVFADALYSAGIGAVSGGVLGSVNNTEAKYVKQNTDLFKNFKTQLEETKSNLTNKNEIAKYDRVINSIDDYLQRPFGNELKAQNVLPTVQEIVAQENKKRESVQGLQLSNETISTMWEKPSTLTNSNAPSSTSETKGSDISSTTTNNIAQSNESVNSDKSIKVPIKENKLSYQGTNHSGDKANGRGITVDKMSTEVEKMAQRAPKTLESTPAEALEQIQKVKNNPEAEITIYRGSPKGEINVGDWVFLSETQAEKYTKGIITGTPIAGYEVGKLTVKAKDVDWTGKNLEFVYSPNTSTSNYNQDIIKQTKGNIPINRELLNKYSTVKEIFDNESNNYDGNVEVKHNINELNNINIHQLSSSETKVLAKEIFNKYNAKNTFENAGNKITVTGKGIEESINKIFESRQQRELLKEHLQVFSDLGDIIEHATLVNQSRETKERKNINSWNYYFDGLKINGKKYSLEFDVRSMDNGQNQYRVQRLEIKDVKKIDNSTRDVSNNTKILRAFESSISDNNIPQFNEFVKLPVISNNNTQNIGNNSKKIMNPNEISKLTLEDANTTPKLPMKHVSTGRGESHFAKNIENKVDMLSKESKVEILDANEVKYYQEVTNKASLEKAFERLNEGGESETLNWFNKDSTKATDVDVAEGWILLKQYQDKIQNATDLATKDTETKNMVQVAKKLREMGTKAGQTVQAYNILNRLTPEGMVYYAQSELSEAFEIMSKNKTKEWIDSNRERFNLTPQETEFIMKTMQEIQQMEDGYDKRVKLAEIQKVMTDKLPPSKGSGIKAWMRISMLFNPKTQVRNVMGNAIIAPVNVFGDLFASAVDKQIAKKTGVRTTGTIDSKSYLKGFKEGAYQSYNDFKRGINTRNIQGNRFEITEGKSFSDKNILGKGLNKVDSLLSFMLDAGDRTFYEATFTNSINNQLKLNNTTEVTQAMIDIATTEALSRTWQDNNDYTRFVLKMRQGLNMIHMPGLNGYGLGDVLIPFAKTPANLTKAIWDYSPAGLVTTITKGINLKRALTNGQYNAQMQHQFVQSLGKATAGSMLYILGIALAKASITTGESDDDKDVANFMKNTLGVSSYSIKIGNKSFTYDWAQPIAAPFSMTANFIQKQKEGADLKENIMSTLDTGLNVLFEQSFLESISNVLSESGQIGTKLIEQLLDLPSRAVPTLFKQIADLIDPVQRQSFEKDKPLETAINKVKAKVPLLSKTLAPSVDTMGREIQKYGGKNNIFNVFLNPANVNTENISKSAAEIYRLYKITGDATIMPRIAPYNINQNGEKILLNSEQRAQYQEISGNIIESSIKELLTKSSYKSLSDIEKADIINKIVGYSYNKARKEVLGIEMSNTYNKINQYAADGGKVSNYYLNKEEIDYSYNNPEKYKVITQITTYDKYLTYQDKIDNVKTKYTNSAQRKTAVIKYVNSLNLSIPQKAMLIKLNYSSYDSYNDKIIQYINKQNLTKQEKTVILTKLGFTIRNGRVYS